MIEEFKMMVTPFNQKRTIRVYLPKGYPESKSHYPVLYMHDGQNVFRDEESIGGVSLRLGDYLDEAGIGLIVVAIDTPPTTEERLDQYCPWPCGEFSKELIGSLSPHGGKGDEYIDYIVNELKPYIDSTYKTIQDNTMMAGCSLGGLITARATFLYPDIFKRVAAISVAFWRNQEEVENMLTRSEPVGIEKFYMDCGNSEVPNDERISKGFLESNRTVYALLKEKVVNSRFEVIDGAAHHYSFFVKRMPQVLDYLLS
ncbi:esterase [Bacillus sp. FJAT-18017]|uniref:alpha/beta hydrolase n=1 Tax=Bacillus sp. FJAT-18017 TaxID=1705566 RepID=UPI0006AE8E36|nr:alpha/beta hydrolase-fold protein [Bacillus sp. FJAT-18017]ALC88996.1 esterase [Bacillus sp. FJAT-18017]